MQQGANRTIEPGLHLRISFKVSLRDSRSWVELQRFLFAIGTFMVVPRSTVAPKEILDTIQTKIR